LLANLDKLVKIYRFYIDFAKRMIAPLPRFRWQEVASCRTNTPRH
jgi:hypothetical protein